MVKASIIVMSSIFLAPALGTAAMLLAPIVGGVREGVGLLWLILWFFAAVAGGLLADTLTSLAILPVSRLLRLTPQQHSKVSDVLALAVLACIYLIIARTVWGAIIGALVAALSGYVIARFILPPDELPDGSGE